MKPQFKTLNVAAAATGVGTAEGCEDLVTKWVQIWGTFNATVAVEGTMDGSHWFTFQSVTAPGVVECPVPVKSIRINVTVWASGQASAIFGSYNARTE